MERIARVVYGKNEKGREYYEIQFFVDNEWDTRYRYYFHDEDFLHFEIVKEILFLIDLGYSVHGIVNADEV